MADPINRDRVFATWEGDLAQHEPFLVCERCGEQLCTVEEGDLFGSLVAVVDEHVCPSKETP